MGVYIKGMDKPMSCASCRLCIDDDCVLQEELYYSFMEQRENCPLIEVKAPHGELIDRVTAIRSLLDYHTGMKSIGQCIDDTPTVIEAEVE